ncbi:beta-xylosidase/alpha-l-arabinosidase [Saccharopolyspora mangrovi]|uniref:Glycoside hydrolase family 3 N-terminal domain-containing protein n=1 Tax=Saccharopolyspora mangrovi TaxID=3082379 RepID=A0ABU6AEM9_9PSEU|nr:glycoside hydrolase family 3 N-terminal domain-containing protein [Saccharopolyspora sp. S2-29]MEB3369901.1 glycoside hydrolase family 3 N-terminal domain-containing protein [Saccharopolyspora sp. S2-29]
MPQSRPTDDRQPYRDPALPVEERVADLVSRMTLEEKLNQLVGMWIYVSGAEERVAPHQEDFADDTPPWDEMIKSGLGQLTRVFGSAPIAPADGAAALTRLQREITGSSRFGIPAVAHEECLAGFTAWGATAYPVPLSWGASFDPQLVGEMAASIGADMRSVGVHQGLAPVLDVVRDLRWGRVEETIGEDPYLIGSIGSAYVAGLESSGIVATLKHFAGYSASRAGRNLAPVSMGAREFADVVLPPFEMALRLGGARSVMHSYTDVDGMPSAADEALLTDLLRDELGFTGTVVADYFGVSFLHKLHGVADGPGTAGAAALRAGVDVELPNARCYVEPLARLVRTGEVDESLVDRALSRVLGQKVELGLLDPDWSPEVDRPREFDSAPNRALARRLAEESVVLVTNDGTLPVREPGRVAVVGPLADDPFALLGCYSFPAHIGVSYPDWPNGIELPTFRDEIARVAAHVDHVKGCDLPEGGADFEAARNAAAGADLCVAVVGDRAGLFGRGTSGEGCDAADLRLPGEQEALVEELLETGTPVVLVVSSGRPYALGKLADRAAAVVQVFFPGEAGAAALTGVLTGEVNPSGRLPVSIPATPGGNPGTYLTAPLGAVSEVSSLDPTALFPFGHGLSYTSFAYSDLAISAEEVPTDGAVDVSCTVTNTGDRDGDEVVQLYLRDPVAQVTRPVRQLAGFSRVSVPAGQSRRVSFLLHADRTAYSGARGRRIVDPGLIEVHVGGDSAKPRLSGEFRLVGEVREVGADRVLDTPVTVSS